MKLSVVVITNTNFLIDRNRFTLSNELVVLDNIHNNNLIDFSILRNTAIKKAKGEWILMVDSDEDLSEELVHKIPELMKDSDVDGYWFRRRNYITSTRYLKYGLFYPDWQLRLFRNKNYIYHGAVHELLTIPEEKTKKIPVDILHFPTHPKYTKFSDFANLKPYVRIYAHVLAAEKHSLSWYYMNGCKQFIRLFIGGYFRGKGFLDGWAGIRAHLMFAWSITLSYFLAPKYFS